ncbi:MAG: AAA family ATPase [Stigonema ocellatum SAG 48.90 = DSM 106950]|nr:AAA family ATPase [Stigonema ocellatum SAG 48.90 = DSM 106950]
MVSIPGYRISEKLYDGSRTVVYRAYRETDQQCVVIKLLKNPYPSFSELVQFRHQYTIAKNFNLPGIIQPYSLEVYHNGYGLVMEDFGGISLRDWGMGKKNLSITSFLSEFLHIAIQIVSTLDGLYRHRIIHKDIKPANVLISPETHEVKLIDFSIASVLPRETQRLMSPNVLEGTLAYMSPEQTGRMNRGIDYRTDFYSLGVTFYELLTGQLPFPYVNPIELIHCHIAKQPPKVHEINPAFPPVLSKIVSTLMAKNAEYRYQSALGLKFDLEVCLCKLNETGKIDSFDIGQRDRSDRFMIPEKLYGREQEVQTLQAAFDRIAGGPSTTENLTVGVTDNSSTTSATSGLNTAAELMLVAGFSGIGKTALINEVHKPIVRQRGYFIKGKFDQFNRNIPFSAFVQAFRDLMGQLLSESDTQLETWKSKILQALGENGQVIIEVIPELEQIISQQPPALELSGTAAQNRFNLLFQKFIQVFTTKEHPLVIFLDDLQWADSASLKLMQLLISESKMGYLLLIGAYRDNEVSPAHPLMLTLEEISKAKSTINTIILAPLSAASLNQLVADTLSCSPAVAQSLTQIIYQKTHGNPFFSTQFLKLLYEDGLIQFDFDTGNWQCDIAEVKALSLCDDVVEFMALQLQKLPKATQNVLKLAACIGNQFDLATLAIVHEKSQVETAADLWKALQEGLILPISETYKFFQSETADGQWLIDNCHKQLAMYKFLHDRVQQAAYSLIPEAQQRITHLQIGRLLLKNTPTEEQEEKIFKIVNHLNIGVPLIQNSSECIDLARLNLIAGRRAISATAYSAASNYLETGIHLLNSNSWNHEYTLTVSLYKDRAKAAYLTNNFEKSESLIQLILDAEVSLVDRLETYELLIIQYTLQSRYEQAVQAGREALKLLGFVLPEGDLENELKTEKSRLESNLVHQDIASLIEHREMEALQTRLSMKILANLGATTYRSNQELWKVIVIKSVNLSLTYGNVPESCYSYAALGMILVSDFGDCTSANQFGQLSLQLSEHYNDLVQKVKAKFLVGCLIYPWVKPIHLADPINIDAYRLSLEIGENEIAGSVISYRVSNLCFAGKNLDELILDISKALAFAKSCKHQWAIDAILGVELIVSNLLGLTPEIFSFDTEHLDEATYIRECTQHQSFSGLCRYNILKSQVLYLYGESDQALSLVKSISQQLHYITSVIAVADYNFYYSLILADLYPHAQECEQQTYWQQLEANQSQMRAWADNCPENFLHKASLVDAEMARITGIDLEAVDLYDQSIELAKEHRFLQDEALASELAARFWLSKNKIKIAKGYMEEAYYCYARWGALAKTNDLEKRYPQLLQLILQAHHNRFQLSTTGVSTINASSFQHQTIQENHLTISSHLDSLDLATMLKASQAISSEIQLEQLLTTLMQVVMENAGAKQAALLLLKDGILMVEAMATFNEGVTLLSAPLETSLAIPVTLVNYVKRTLKNVVLDDATAQTDFIADPYVMEQQPKSVLCAPILHQGKLIGLLYLENRLTIGAFTRDRIEVIQLLCAQVAISLENASLYQQSQNYAKQLEQMLQELKQAQLQMVQNEKMAILGNLVAGVAHEINNPLGFLKGSINNAEDYIQDLFAHIECYQKCYPTPPSAVIDHEERIDLEFLAEDLPKLIDSIKVATERIQDISTSLRTFSRADTAEKVACNLHEGIESTLLILKYRLKASNKRPAIEVIKEYGKLPPIKCFLGQLNQVFMNIFVNAIDALDTVSFGRTFAQIQANALQILIRTQLSSDQNTVIIRIKDNGQGIPAEIKARIFDHLFTTKDVGKGTGLGLAIARQIVEETHGGRLSCHSVLGEGAEFVIEIPLGE